MILSSALLVASLASSGITERLDNYLSTVTATEQVPVIVVMKDRLDSRELMKRVETLSRRERAAAVKAELEPFARTTQRGLDAKLAELKKSGEVTFTHRLWTVNAMQVTGTKGAIEELASLPGVDRVRWDPVLLPEEMQDVAPPLAYSIGEAPFGTSFETAVIPPEIDKNTPAGRVNVAANFGPATGFFHMTLDADAAGPEQLVQAELHMDFSGAIGATLEFDAKTFGSGGANEGVWISLNGVDYFQAISFPADSPYTNYNFDVAGFVNVLGKRLNADTRIRFQWGATDELPTSGLAIDNIKVRVTYAASIPAEPNIVNLQAPQLWTRGIDGRGSFILNVDSGVAKEHPDLKRQIWCNPGEIDGNGIDDDNNGYIDDTWGWDFGGNDNNPYDGGHGTNCAGVILGSGINNSGVRTGMAPLATMAVAKISGEGNALAAYQYGVDIGVDVITSSHSFKWPSKPDYHLHRQSAEVELAAGIVHSNSLGNQGNSTSSHPIPFNISAPGLAPGPWVHPQQTEGGVGAIMGCAGILLGGDALYTSSGQGPSTWENLNEYSNPWPHPQNPDYWDYPYDQGAGPGLLKPDIATYTNVKTTQGNTGYNNSFGGTSAATPHLGGALCLLVDANERALPRQLSQALQETAFDLGAAGKDTRYGAGKLQVFDAAERIIGLITAIPQENTIGDTASLEISGPQGSPYILILGGAPGMIPTTFGFNVEIAPPLYLAVGVHTGYSTPTVLGVSVPNDPGFSGFELFMQVATDDTLGVAGDWIISLLETVRWD